MNPFEMVLGIVIVVMIARVLTVRYKAHTPGEPSSALTGDTARMQDELRQLRERVQVLERVITDNHPSADLDRQIERLRDR